MNGLYLTLWNSLSGLFQTRRSKTQRAREERALCCVFSCLCPPPQSWSALSQLNPTPVTPRSLWVGAVGKRLRSGNPKQKEILSERGCCNRAKGERRWSLRKHGCTWGLGWLSSDHRQKRLTAKLWLYLVANAEVVLCMVISGLYISGKFFSKDNFGG